MKRFVAFVPELVFSGTARREFYPGLYFVPPSHQIARELAQDIKDAGHSYKDGAFLFYEGNLEGDLTPYEIFYGYCLALTFFHDDGQVTCRALKEVGDKDTLKLFIDEFDKFGVDPDDVVTLESRDVKKVGEFYEKIIPHLATKDFNAFRNTIEFFALYSKEYEMRVRLLYLSICFESLFLEGNDSEGIGHKLGVRCAAFLKNFDQEIDAPSTYFEVKCGYNLRSKIIHGGDYKKESGKVIQGKASKATRESDHVLILERILKRVLHFLLQNDDFYSASQDKSLGAKIDTELVLEKF